MSLDTEDKDWIRTELRTGLDRVVDTMITEMGVRFGEVNGRLDRIDNYTRVLTDLADLKLRVAKLEGPK